MKSFRALTASEVDVRVGTVSQTGKGVSLLLYKDARCDMNVLDETVGPLNWQKHYSRDNANCTVSIWDEEKKQWISKEDTGTESATEAEKGLASDSFKRACVNWGIGRELYTAPFIWVNGFSYYNEDKKKWLPTNDKFIVSEMKVEDGKITSLVICVNDEEVFRFPKTKTRKTTKTEPKSTVPTAAQGPAPQPKPVEPKPVVNGLADKLVMELEAKAMQKNVTVDQICQRFKVKELSELTNQQYALCLSLLDKSSGRAS